MTRTTPTDSVRRRHAPALARPAARAAFTIIELMVVIIIIGILAAFLIPAITNAVENARVAEVTSEMNRMEAAIAQFENRFGVQPPSGIVLYERLDDGTSGTPDPGWGAHTGNEVQRRTSRALIRQIWPDFNFNVNHDFNHNGMPDDEPIYLNGAECLVFFLGGVTSANSDFTNGVYNVVGFSTNPLAPEQNDAASENRIESFHEFAPGRLVDIDGDRMPEYLDALSNQETPMLYFSSYGGRGYQPYGIDYDPMTGTGVGTADDEILPVALGRGPFAVYYVVDDNKLNNMLRPDGTAWNPDSFQLISPGRDLDYGYGGEFTSDSRFTDAVNPEGMRAPDFMAAEQDNITNFGGRLGF